MTKYEQPTSPSVDGETLPSAETMLNYASFLEKQKFDVRNGVKYPLPNGEPTKAAIAALRYCAALSRSEAPVAWRCFFCDEVFTDAKAASDHFGDTICADPLCKVAQIDGGIAQTIAKLAEQLNRFHIEDNASFREFYALGADHRAALIREEQKGYDRGLKDGQALAAPSPALDPATVEACAKVSEGIAAETADGGGEFYIARKIADSIRALTGKDGA